MKPSLILLPLFLTGCATDEYSRMVQESSRTPTLQEIYQEIYDSPEFQAALKIEFEIFAAKRELAKIQEENRKLEQEKKCKEMQEKGIQCIYVMK
jgi:hypothetical protein